MTDQVENLSVGYDDHISAGAKAAADALKRLGDEAVATETRVTRVAKSGETLTRQYDEQARLAAKVAEITRRFGRDLADLEASEKSVAEKEQIRANILAQQTLAIQKATAANERWAAGMRAAEAAAGGLSAGMALATAAANTWAGSLSRIYEAAGQVTTGLNGAARALQALNSDFRAGHTSFAEWAAGAKGLEAALRGVSAAQKAINDATGVSRQTVNTATIGQLRYATTGKGAPAGNTIGLATGDTAAHEQRLDDLVAAFAEADAAIDRYRADLGLVDVAQRKFEAGLTDLKQAIRLAGVEDGEATKLLAAYTAAHDPAIRRAKERADQERETARAVAEAWDSATREREADAAMILADERATREAAARTAAENAKLAASYDSVMAAVDPAVAAQQRFDKALADLRAGAVAAGKSAADLAADEAKLTDALSPAAIAARKEEDALRSLIGTLDRSYGANDKLAAAQKQLDKAMTDGVGGIKLSAQEHAALSAKLKEQHDLSTRAANSTKLAAHETLNLGYQLQDFVVQVGSGQSAITAMLQQGPQAVGAVGGLSRAWALLVSPVTLVALGVTAVAGALLLVGARAVEVNGQTRELTATMRTYGTEAQATAAQLRDVAKVLYEGGADRQESFAAAKVLASTRGISSALGRELATLGSDMAAGLGQTVDQTVKQLADMAAQGYPAIMKLQEAFGFLTPAEVLSIKTMADHGRQSEALGVALGALHRRFDGMRKDAMSPAATAMHELGVQFNRLVDAAASSQIVIGVTVAISDAFKDLADFLANPSLEGFGKVARIGSAVLSPASGAASGVGGAIGKRLFGSGDTADLQKRLDDARARVADFEGKVSQGQGIYGASLAAAKAEVASLEERIGALPKKIEEAKAAQVVAPSVSLSRRTNDVSAADEAAMVPFLKQMEYAGQESAAQKRLAQALQGTTVERQFAAAAMKAEDDIRQQNLSGYPAELLARVRNKEALAQLVVAVNDTNRAALAEIDGANKVASAYGVSAEAVREAQIQQKAMAEVARGTIEPYDAIVARLRDMDNAQRRVNAAAADFDLRNQIDAAARLARAEATSGAAVAETNVQNKIRAQIIKEGVAADSERARAIEAGTRALEAQNAVAKVNASIRQQNQDLTVARAEYDMLGKTNAERERETAILKATLDVQNSGDWQQVPKETRDAWIAQAGAVAEYKARVADATETSRDFANVITKGFEDAILNGQKFGDVLRALVKDVERVFLRGFVTKPLENWLTGTMTKWLSPPPANDNMVRPVNDNDPGGNRALFDRLSRATTLGTSADNAMWVRVAADIAGQAGIPQTAGSLALAPTTTNPLPVAIQGTGQIADLIRQEARAQGVPEDVALSIARIESEFRQYRPDGRVLTSSAGAQGVMQLMPGTAQWLGVDASDTRQNIQGGVRFLAMLGRQFNGDWNAVAGAYNAGPTRMGQYLAGERGLPRETVDYIAKFGSAMKDAGTSVTGLGGATRGVTQAQEDALQAQLDAITAQQAATDSAQALTDTQKSWVAAALGLAKANDNASGTIEVTSRAISTIGDNAVSAADGMTAAGDGAKALGKAATDGADTLLGGLGKLLSGAESWLGGLFGASGSGQQKTIRNADGSTSFSPRVQGAGGSWLDTPIFGAEQSRPSDGFVGPMPAEQGIGGWNPTWGQTLQGIGGIASGVMTAARPKASVGQQIGGGLMAVGGVVSMAGAPYVGAVMMAAGALLSAVSGAKDRGEKYSISHITLQPNGRYQLGTYAQDNDGDPVRFNADASKVAKGLNDIAARLNLTPTRADSYIDTKNKSAEQAALELLKGMQSAVPNVAYALAHETTVSLEDMLKHLEFANSFDVQIQGIRSSLSDLFAQFRSGVDDANSFARSLLDIVDNAQTVFALPTGSAGFLPPTRGYATGTRSAASGWAMVGEEGPELVRLAGGERIWNARETAQMVAGLGQGADTELVHVRPDELAWMERTLGGGRTNPATGLRMFLEGESGGVGDTGDSGRDTGGGTSGGGTGGNASGRGGENSAHGETGNQSSGYGPAGPDHGWGSYDGPAARAGNEDAVNNAGLIGAVTGLIDQFTGFLSRQTGVPQGQIGALTGVVGVTGALAVGGLYGLARGIGDIADRLGIAGETAPAGTGGETAGTGSEPGLAQRLPAEVATQLLDLLRTTPAASDALIGASQVGPVGGGEVSISQVAEGGVLQGMESSAVAQMIGEVSSALVSLRDAAVPIPPVLQRAAEQLDAVAAAQGIPGATDRVRQDAEAQQNTLYDRFAAVGLVRTRVDELNGIVASLANNTFSPVGKDFDALAADMRRAAGVYTAAGQQVPESLFAATRQMEALGAVRKRLLDEVAGNRVEGTTEEKKVEQIRGQWSNTATDLVKAFASVGIAGAELAARLNEGLTNALNRERATYGRSLDVARRASQGDAGYDSAVSLIEEYGTRIRDINALWPEGADRAARVAEVTETLRSAMEGLARSGSITSSNLQGIITTFASTPAAVDAATAALRRLNEAAAESTRTYNAGVDARAWAAVGGQRTSALLQMDEQQRRELADATTAGRDTTTLRQVQLAERQAQAFTLAQQDVLEAYDRQIAAQQTLAQSIQDTSLKVYNAAKQFQAARDSLAISEDAPISPQERLAEARRQWDVALATVRSSTASDEQKDTARSTLTQLGQTLVTIEKTNSAGTARSLYDEVMRVFGELGNTQALGVDNAQQQLTAANNTLRELQRSRQDAANIGQRQLGSLDALRSVMDQSYAIWQSALVPLRQITGQPAARYGAPADVQAIADRMTNDDMVQLARGIGFTGGIGDLNAWIMSQGKQSDFEAAMRAHGRERPQTPIVEPPAPPTTQSPIVDPLPLQYRLDHATNEQIERWYGSQPDIVAARAAGTLPNLAEWYWTYGKQETLDGRRSIPAFAAGGLVGNGMWGQDSVLARYAGGGHIMLAGGEYVMPADVTANYRPMLDAMRAGDFAPANDRVMPFSLTPIRPAVAPAAGGGNAEVVAELRRLNDRMARVEKAIHEAEGDAQDQRAVLLARLTKEVAEVSDELANLKPARAA